MTMHMRCREQVVYKFNIEYNENVVTDPLTPEVTARLDEILGELNYGAESSGDLFSTRRMEEASMLRITPWTAALITAALICG